MAQMKAKFNFVALNEFLGNKNVRKVGHNTLVERFDNFIIVKLHGNEIMRFDSDGTLYFTDANWQTVTTKNRLNSVDRNVFNFAVSQNDYQWFVSVKDIGSLEFKDINIILPDGSFQQYNYADSPMYSYWNVKLSTL